MRLILSNMKVTVYGTPSCQYCDKTKEWLNNNGVEYDYVDVAANPEERLKMINISEQMGVPVTVVGADIVLGFNEELLTRLCLKS